MLGELSTWREMSSYDVLVCYKVQPPHIKINRTGPRLSYYRVSVAILYYDIRCKLAWPKPDSPVTIHPVQPWEKIVLVTSTCFTSEGI